MNNNLKYGLIALGATVIAGTVVTYRKSRSKQVEAKPAQEAILAKPEASHDAAADGVAATTAAE